MKPYVAEILERDGKTCLLPMPAKYRELKDCARTLGIKDEGDEFSMQRTGYKTILVPAPDRHYPHCLIRQTADELYKLDNGQVRAIGALCDAFALTFGDIMGVLAFIYPNLREE